MKKVLLAATLCTVLNTLTFASKQPLTTQSTTTLSDVQQLFQVNISQPLQLATLSQKEMKETEGALGPMGALGGAAIGGIFYTGHAIGSGSWSWGSFGTAMAGGAITGFSGGAAAAYFVPRVIFGLGVVSGKNGW